ncbi:hypothetical protein dqs_3015 [Azoarcus olearius]|nr:hypothetical protein dqs_3015 [Azoarcus olearius]
MATSCGEKYAALLWRERSGLLLNLEQPTGIRDRVYPRAGRSWTAGGVETPATGAQVCYRMNVWLQIRRM